MPRGQPGCYRCGKPTLQLVQIWMREYTEETYPGGCRKERSVATACRSFCVACAEAVYGECAPALSAQLVRAKGCRCCGKQRAERRVQVWLRATIENSSKSIATVGGSYCTPCAKMVYEYVETTLDGVAKCPSST